MGGHYRILRERCFRFRAALRWTTLVRLSVRLVTQMLPRRRALTAD